MQIGFKTDRGNKRAVNEDALFVMPEDQLYIVADGVGGHNSGELASRTAVESIATYVVTNPLAEVKTLEALKGYFLECLRVVNSKIFTMAQIGDENKGMATTVVMAYIVKNTAYVVNLGDSRAYLTRGNKMEQITEDHSYVNELVQSGEITLEEAVFHPERNKITRALGAEKHVIPDFYKIDIMQNDVICLCSDGLHNEVSKESMCEMTASAPTMSALADELVNLANKNGGNDNITLICLKI